jgi:hypothetical protein
MCECAGHDRAEYWGRTDLLDWLAPCVDPVWMETNCWEGWRRCRDCGEIWYSGTSGGHAIVEFVSKLGHARSQCSAIARAALEAEGLW